MQAIPFPGDHCDKIAMTGRVFRAEARMLRAMVDAYGNGHQCPRCRGHRDVTFGGVARAERKAREAEHMAEGFRFAIQRTIQGHVTT